MIGVLRRRARCALRETRALASALASALSLWESENENLGDDVTCLIGVQRAEFEPLFGP